MHYSPEQLNTIEEPLYRIYSTVNSAKYVSQRPGNTRMPIEKLRRNETYLLSVIQSRLRTSVLKMINNGTLILIRRQLEERYGQHFDFALIACVRVQISTTMGRCTYRLVQIILRRRGA